jgi:hypothetical protein
VTPTAVQSIAVPPDPKRDARARELVASVATWPKHTLKVAWGSFEAGTVFRRDYGSNGERYLVNAVACQCADFQRAGFICKHVRAVVAFEQRQQPSPKASPSYADLFEGCRDCGDLADGLDGRCSKCASDLEFRQRMDSRRELVANL